MSLADLARAVRERRVSSAELVSDSLERIERQDGPVNAVVLVRGDDALRHGDELGHSLVKVRE